LAGELVADGCSSGPERSYTVNVIGKQQINKVVAGAVQKETKQLRLTIKLVADNKGRADRNLRSGFLISYLDSHELNDFRRRSFSAVVWFRRKECDSVTRFRTSREVPGVS